MYKNMQLCREAVCGVAT